MLIKKSTLSSLLLITILTQAMTTGAFSVDQKIVHTLDPEILAEAFTRAISKSLETMEKEFQAGKPGSNAIKNIVKAVLRESSAETGKVFKKGGEADIARAELGGALKRLSEDVTEAAEGFGHASVKMLIKHGLVIVGIIGGTVAVYYLSKYGWKRYFDNRPKLLLNQPTGYFDLLKEWTGFSEPQPIKMVLESKLAAQLTEFLATTQAIRAEIERGNKRAEYTNIILCGPPGTGKTMFAEKLAAESGMKLAKISAAGLAALGNEAIAEIDKIFALDDVVILIDEVDSLLGNRKDINFSSDNYKIINHILGYTGKASQKRILVMTTNLVENVDPALIDRASIVYVGLPNINQRKQMITLAAGEQLFQSHNGQAFIAQAKKVFNQQKIDEMAAATEGMSNRNICSIINTVYSKALLPKTKTV